MGSCGKKIIKTYHDDNDWNQQFYAATSDTSGYCYIHFKNTKNSISANLNYSSTYQTANELIYLDFDIIVSEKKLEPSKEIFRANDSNYKLFFGTENTIPLKKNEDWQNLGTQLKIDTVINEYLNFTVLIDKKYKVQGELPKEIQLNIHTKTKLGVKDTSVIMYYQEYEDTRAPFRFH